MKRLLDEYLERPISNPHAVVIGEQLSDPVLPLSLRGETPEKRIGHMPQDSHKKAAEHHEIAAKSHRTAAEHHEKGDNKVAAEHATKAHEHSTEAHKHSTEAHAKSAAKK